MKHPFHRFNQVGQRSRLLVVSGLSILLAAGIWGCAPAPQKSETPAVKQSNTEEAGVIELSPSAISKIGLETATVSDSQTAGMIETTGQVRANENRLFHISSFVEGRVIQDNTFLGDYVRNGQTLALVQNQQIAQIQADYIHQLHRNEIDISQAKSRFNLAQKVLTREQQLFKEGISPRRDLEAAEAAYEQAKSAYEGEKEHQIHIKSEGKALMSAYGMSPGNTHKETLRTTSPVKAPRSGVVIEKNITSGDMVTPQTVMYSLADLSEVWLDITVYPQDFNDIRPGQTARFTTDSYPNKVFTGKIDYIPPQTNGQTQAFVARAFLPNPGTQLKPGMFGTVSIQMPNARKEAFVPEEAVQRVKDETFVFRVLQPGVYKKQPIQTDAKLNDGYLVKSGLKAGDQVVTKGSFTLKAELLKDEVGESE